MSDTRKFETLVDRCFACPNLFTGVRGRDFYDKSYTCVIIDKHISVKDAKEKIDNDCPLFKTTDTDIIKMNLTEELNAIKELTKDYKGLCDNHECFDFEDREYFNGKVKCSICGGTTFTLRYDDFEIIAGCPACGYETSAYSG